MRSTEMAYRLAVIGCGLGYFSSLLLFSFSNSGQGPIELITKELYSFSSQCRFGPESHGRNWMSGVAWHVHVHRRFRCNASGLKAIFRSQRQLVPEVEASTPAFGCQRQWTNAVPGKRCPI
jgi:hypothetical protein